MILLYCKYTGMPYKSERHYANVRRCAFAATYWSLAYCLKFSSALIPFLDIHIYPDGSSKTINNEEGLLAAIIFFAVCVFSDLVPFLLVLDNEFIKIFSFDMIKQFN
jgi:hypothetical protein